MKTRCLVTWCLTLAIAGTAAARAQQTVNFPNFCNVSSFTLNGDAGALNPNPECVLRLTNALSQSSSAWLTNTFSLAADASFSTLFSFRMTNPQGIGDTDGQGADGIVFAVQTAGNNVGGGGQGIGYGGISPSVGIEFDTFQNFGEINGNHVGIDLNGVVDGGSAVVAPVTPRLNDGNVWYAWVDYNGVTDLLEVRLAQALSRPASPIVSLTVNLPVVLGTTNAFLGFTSGTGSGGNNHEILTWQFVGAFQPFPGGPAVNVPTLSYGMQIALGLLLAAAAIWIFRRS